MIRVRVGDICLGADEKKQLQDVIDSGRFSEGPKTREFQKEWASAVGTKYCVAVNSGTSALIAGLYALLYDDRFPKVKKGAKVITSPVSYVATSNAIVLAGMEPVYVDINPQTFSLDTEQIRVLLEKENPDDFAMILPVHLMGYMNDMGALQDICTKFDLVLFEDAAQAHGSQQNGQKAGSFGLLADFSFYIAHNVQVGEMGAVVTSDKRLRELLVKVKTNGRICSCPSCTRSQGKCPYANDSFDPRFTHDLVGFNFKINEFQAAIGLPQVRRIDQIIRARQQNVKKLNELLAKFQNQLCLPLYDDSVSYLAYPILIKDPSINREILMHNLEKAGIETRPLFGCIPTQQPAFKHLWDKYENKLPVAELVGGRGFYIGCHQYLTEDDLEFIAHVFSSVIFSK